ncbi:hypothetical protein Hanom_Chr10g00881321 [Helianthus anomalus]
MNKRTLKQDSTPKAPSRRVKATCVDIENAPIRILRTMPTSNTQYRPRIKKTTLNRLFQRTRHVLQK